MFPGKLFLSILDCVRADVGSYDQTKEVSFVSGCALLVRAEAVRKVGLLDEIFFMGYEDVDWSVRALRAGYKAMYVSRVGCVAPRFLRYEAEHGICQAGFLQHEKRRLVRAQVSAPPPVAFVRILHEQVCGLCHAQVYLSGGFQAGCRPLSRSLGWLAHRAPGETPLVIML